MLGQLFWRGHSPLKICIPLTLPQDGHQATKALGLGVYALSRREGLLIHAPVPVGKQLATSAYGKAYKFHGGTLLDGSCSDRGSPNACEVMERTWCAITSGYLDGTANSAESFRPERTYSMLFQGSEPGAIFARTS